MTREHAHTCAHHNPSVLTRRAFHAGIEPEPVMCQTVNSTLVNNCNWASCGEWCLTKTSGFCPQIFSTARRNGSDLDFENCSRVANIYCPMVRPTDISTRFVRRNARSLSNSKIEVLR